MEVRRTLLDDRDVLLSGNHLCAVSERVGSTGWTCVLCLLLGLVVVTILSFLVLWRIQSRPVVGLAR